MPSFQDPFTKARVEAFSDGVLLFSAVSLVYAAPTFLETRKDE